jgi:hypothetical protein
VGCVGGAVEVGEVGVVAVVVVVVDDDAAAAGGDDDVADELDGNDCV